jgi:hypothetical protein
MAPKHAIEEGGMTWRAYQVILRLHSPLHIGCGKVGNLQRARPYVTGRVLWGALTMRLTRDEDRGGSPANDASDYRRVGEQVHQNLSFTYFYPAIKSEEDYQVVWPWENESHFRCRFLSSYQGIALSYPQQSAAEGMLHEVEYLSPSTLDTGEAVFLKGYVFEKEGCALDWRAALRRLQMGGERGYGWGTVTLVNICTVTDGALFGNRAIFKGGDDVPLIYLPAGERLLAHTVAANLPATGDVEPLVGREWRSENKTGRHIGQHVAFTDICFGPGSVIRSALDFKVEEYGVWRRLEESA